jgi:hypothetical protein
MNPTIRIELQSHKAGKETTQIHTPPFMRIRTVPAMSSTVLLESGTLGAKAHIQTIIPITWFADWPSDAAIPMFIIHYFSPVIDYLCVWVRDVFAGRFEREPQSVSNYLEGKMDVPRGSATIPVPC